MWFAWTALMLPACAAQIPAPRERRPVEYRATHDRPEVIFDAVLQTLFDQDYVVTMCDRRSGLVGSWSRIDGIALTVLVDRAKGEVRATTSDMGQPFVHEGRINAFYTALGSSVSLRPAAGGAP
ncbi:MAG: hypothetical protein IT437_01550 [Phycisphaerales bacterium]|nr:hypothetical protein [Phycisphaerales bacterium]